MVEAHIHPGEDAAVEHALSIIGVIVCVILGGLMSGLTVGLLSLDPLNLRVRRARAAGAERVRARRRAPTRGRARRGACIRLRR
jgi:hypothetical protein